MLQAYMSRFQYICAVLFSSESGPTAMPGAGGKLTM